MSRDIEYIRQYIGPVFLVDKKSIKFSTISRNIESCPNTVCPKHQEPVRGMPLHCFECGSKITDVHCVKHFEETPSVHSKSFHDQCLGLSNHQFNGISCFMEPNVELFTDKNKQVYVPKFKKDKEYFAIMNNKTVGQYCINEECMLCNRYENREHKHCEECGGKLFVNITHDVYGPIQDTVAISVFECYMHKNHDHFEFIDNPEWEHFVETYQQTEHCKELISVIEKTYGEGSVTMKLAFVSYHSIY